MAMNRIARPRGLTAWRLALTCCVVACNSDTVCVTQCALSTPAEISVTASNAPAGIVGLTMTVTGPVLTGPDTSCSQGPGGKDVCTIYGAPGDYHVTLNAPGYQSSVLSFTATGKTVGCCGDLADTQTLSVVMQPASD
jgi:hypothetical protein